MPQNAPLTSTLRDNCLHGHSCNHCKTIVLPGEREEIYFASHHFWDTPLDQVKFATTQHFRRLNISLADLERKSCEFARFLSRHIGGRISEQVDRHAVQVFTYSDVGSSLSFRGLICLGNVHDPNTAPNGIDLNRCFMNTSAENAGHSSTLCLLTVDEGMLS